MENRQVLTERLLSWDASLGADDILLPVDFNLTQTSARTRVNGTAVLLKNKICTLASKLA